MFAFFVLSSSTRHEKVMVNPHFVSLPSHTPKIVVTFLHLSS